MRLLLAALLLLTACGKPQTNTASPAEASPSLDEAQSCIYIINDSVEWDGEVRDTRIYRCPLEFGWYLLFISGSDMKIDLLNSEWPIPAPEQEPTDTPTTEPIFQPTYPRCRDIWGRAVYCKGEI